MPYLDRTDSHYRFAAYQMSAEDAAAGLQLNYDAISKKIEQDYQLGQSEIAGRIQQSRIAAGASTGAARIGANASMANAKLQAAVEREKLALAKDEMERIGIPDMLIRKFVAEKNYEIAKQTLGLDIISKAVEWNSTPDKYFQGEDFNQQVRAGLGEGGVLSAPTARAPGTPTPNSLFDLVNRLAPGTGGGGSTGDGGGSVPGITAPGVAGAPAGVAGGTAPSGASALGAAITGQGLGGVGSFDVNNMSQQDLDQWFHLLQQSGGAGLGDPRIAAVAKAAQAAGYTVPQMTPQQAAQSVVANNPPSPYAGLSSNDQAALSNIAAQYQTGLDFRNLDQSSPTQLGMLKSGGSRLGYDPTLEFWRAGESRPGQQSSRLA